MADPLVPSAGLGVLHLFCKPTERCDATALVDAVRAAEKDDCQVATIAMLGHKADIALMAMHRDLRVLRNLQTSVRRAGLDVVDSYVSLTEVSEYAKGMPEAMLQRRLYPEIPPRVEGQPMNAWCFYPMSKRRGEQVNWFTLPYDERNELMREHGASGRTFAGRVVQYITGSAGTDDHEWGVTLFAARPDDLKEVVYTMRFDRASALYAEFGRFYTGMVTAVDELADEL
jgi:hydrogen peroxide-dependent heme synthase